MSNKKDEYVFENLHVYNVHEKSRKIFVHAEFEPEESGVDFRMSVKTVKNLIHLDSLSNDPIELHFLTYGGCWNYGMSIYDTIKTMKSPVTSVSYAHARSMSSIIPQAATTRLIHKNCDFMVHYGTYGDEGDFRKVLNGIKHYELANDIMLNIYADKCVDGEFFMSQSMSHDQVKSYIKSQIEVRSDWWMNADEAVYYGFMDRVI